MNSSARHQALAVSSEPHERDDPDFDFLAQQPRFRRNLCTATWLFRIGVALVLFLILVLLAVDLSRDDTCEVIPMESFSCFFPMGGGETPPHDAVPQTHIASPRCVQLFTKYFRAGGQYWTDTQTAIDSGRVLLDRDGNYSQMVILDIDETSLSNLPVYQSAGFAPTPDVLGIWFGAGTDPAIPATLEFYQALRRKGFSVAFLTGRHERSRAATEQNLEAEGYGHQCRRNPAPDGQMCYYELILRNNGDFRDATVYKSVERRRLMEEEGFHIIASVGDQWSDLLGTDRPGLLIKMPNPLYYIA